jgi:putative ATP-dependent endonuclease of the OLD family
VWISRVTIRNFRNFRSLDVRLHGHVVIVGENSIGKSNFLFALRLLLDPTLPESARTLRHEDFWDGLARPLKVADRITISVELCGFEDNPDLLAVLSEHVVDTEPMTAKLTYEFGPKPDATDQALTEADYEFSIYGRAEPDDQVRGPELRRRLPLDVLQALRDAEGDLANWRRSPLRPLLDEAARQIDRGKLKSIVESVAEATHEVTETEQIEGLATKIADKVRSIVGAGHAIDTSLGFSPSDPDRLIRALRLFIDGGRRGIGEASLGSANILYLALKALELEQLVKEGLRSHTFLAIEEPEAHLHPHLQRLVYREFLRPRTAPAQDAKESPAPETRTVILTTHSPHIASVSPLRSIVLLRKASDLKSTEGMSTASIPLTEAQERDLERYLDVTRGEMLFAKGVLLVEGDAELFLLPALARLSGFDLDELGITVASVAGTNFLPYVKLLNALKTPFAVLTDRDPDGTTPAPGQKRLLRLLAEIEGEPKGSIAAQILRAAKAGLFVAEHCLEVDLFKCGRHKSMGRVLAELGVSGAAQERGKAWREKPEAATPEALLKDIEAISKGRFAQRLASRISGTACPEYIKAALKHVADRCR